MKNFFDRMLGKKEPKKGEYVFTTRHMAEPTGNGDRIRRGGGSGNSLDGTFITIDQLTNSYSATNSMVGSSAVYVPGDAVKSSKPGTTPERKEVEPKEVFNEIKRETPEISFDDLPYKIAAVEERIKILSEHLDPGHLKDEQRALFYLKNRQKYLETRDKYPLDWAITTTEAIDDLCKRYKLKVVPLKQFYTLVPKEGLDEMKKYSKAYKAMTGDEPIYELVVKDTPPANEERRKKDRDPILVANSPLGNHLFILGVWDDEVAIVDEIIYGFK